jgi:uncharacterized membrane protein
MAGEVTVVGIFRDSEAARNAVSELRGAGVPAENIGLVARGHDSTVQDEDLRTDVAADAGIGAALGGIGGLLLGFTALAIPGVGPALAAGPLLAALGGAGLGAVAGGILGALNEAGVPEADARHYSEQVRDGGVLVTVRTDEAQAERVRAILDAPGDTQVRERAPSMEHAEGAGSPSECDLRTDDDVVVPGRTAGVTGHNAGGETKPAVKPRTTELKRSEARGRIRRRTTSSTL